MSLLGALSAIREVVVSKLFDFALDKLCSSEFLQFATDKQIQEELQKLKMELKEIRAVLDDAEERQLKDQSVKIWLSNLQNLAYEVDDIVDELETEISMRNLMSERRGSSRKKARFSSDPFNVMSNKDMMSRIKDITAKLKASKHQKEQLQLKMIGCQKSNRVKERLQPTSLEIEPDMYGRDNDKKAILELVFNSDDEGNFVIPIVGMGGIGKTTLAQFVYNDKTIQEHFDLKAWVCVSDVFDVTRITKAIFQAVTNSESCKDDDLILLQQKLKGKLSHKKFLIVLDDVWNEDYQNWTILQAPFLTRIPGSKIIVTTRSSVVSSTMSVSSPHYLNVLSDYHCLSIIARHALGAKDFGGRTDLKEVAEKIARKCNGLPLAAKTLGGLLRTYVNHDAWKDILESEIWKLSEEHHCGIIPALQLSYHHLPPDLKRCFAYCSIIPKDYEFGVEEIILLWRAQGFLQEARDKHSIEDPGQNYFRDLVARSLLQISNKDRSRFVMHDLINDLAQSVAGEICFRIENDQQISKKQISEHARHLSYIGGRCDGIQKFKGISEAQYLRTFLPLRLSNGGLRSYLTRDVLTNLLPILRCLRVLSLSRYSIATLPDIFGDLKHLRYLDLSHTDIECLPESINKLYNLETLLLRDCWCLEKLPSEMENLINLCYLDISGAHALEGFSSNFGTLRDLQVLSLSNFDLHVGEGLWLLGLESIVKIKVTGEAKLHDVSGLDKLKWSATIENRIVEIEKKLLDSLQHSKKLNELALVYNCGERLAERIGHFSFGELRSLCLEHCPNCISLPSIGQLPLLKKVCIRGLHSVTSVGVEFFGKNSPNVFPSLEILEFEDMLNWENWNVYEVDEEAKKFPRLRELCISDCPKLLGSIPEYLPSLEKLVIFNCEKLVISIQSFPMLSELEIEGCQKVVLGSSKAFANDRSLKRVFFSIIPEFIYAVESLTLGSIKVEFLKLEDCDKLCFLQVNNWGLLTQSMSVVILDISKWSQLVSVGAEEEREELMHLKIPCSIQQLRINDCIRLEKLSTTFHHLKRLTELELCSCPSLISLSKNNLPLNLKILKIRNCENLQCLLEEGENVDTSTACLLEQLHVYNCPSLVSLSSRGELPTRLKYLEMWSCSKLEYIAQEFQDNSSLESIILSGSSNIKYLPQGLSKLSHLQRIWILICSNLVFFPESGLPTSNLKELTLRNCDGLQALPDGIHNLNSLEQLTIADCSGVTSIPEEGVPTNLKRLHIGGPNICKPLIKWGLHRLTSLESLKISNGCPDAVLFPQEEIGMVLPCSLTTLKIHNFPKLEILSSNGFQGLTSLKSLHLRDCPKLKSLPEKDMLLTLLDLYIFVCPMLKQRCTNVEGPEWSKIAHVPLLDKIPSVTFINIGLLGAGFSLEQRHCARFTNCNL